MFTSWISRDTSSASTSESGLLSQEAYGLMKEEKWQTAGEKYEAAAHASPPNSLQEASYWNDAANCFRKENCHDALLAYKKAAEIFKKCDKASTGGRILEEAAEMLKNEDRIEEAVSLIEEAAELFSTSDRFANSFVCFAKAGDLIAESRKNFDKAEKYYLMAIPRTGRYTQLQYASVNYCLKACLCRLISHPENTNQLVWELEERCPEFHTSHQLVLIYRLMSVYLSVYTDICDPVRMKEAVEDYSMGFQLDKDIQLERNPIDNATHALLDELETRVKAKNQPS